MDKMKEINDSVDNKISKPSLIYYDSAAKYWSQIPPTIDGMLGGFGFISSTDIKGSQCFLKHLFKINEPPGKGRAADCGAGIGRVTKNLLIKFFNQVDLVEQNLKFLEEAKSFIGAKGKTVNYFNIGLQDFSPKLNTYDVIWSQWVLGHLTDEDLVMFFKSCKRGLQPKGVIVVKENFTSSEKVEVDDQDSSITRPPQLFTKLYKQAGLQCIHQQKQTNFPKGIYQVIMFALRPVGDSRFTDINMCQENSNNINSCSAAQSCSSKEAFETVGDSVCIGEMDLHTINHTVILEECGMLPSEHMDQECPITLLVNGIYDVGAMLSTEERQRLPEESEQQEAEYIQQKHQTSTVENMKMQREVRSADDLQQKHQTESEESMRQEYEILADYIQQKQQMSTMENMKMQMEVQSADDMQQKHQTESEESMRQEHEILAEYIQQKHQTSTVENMKMQMKVQSSDDMQQKHQTESEESLRQEHEILAEGSQQEHQTSTMGSIQHQLGIQSTEYIKQEIVPSLLVQDMKRNSEHPN